MRKSLIIVTGVVFVIATGVGWVFNQARSKPGFDPKNFQAVTVERKDIRLSISAAGTIAPQREIEVKSEASGEVLKVYVEAGDSVKKGQLLMALDKTDETTKVNKAEASLMSARAGLIKSQETLSEAERQYRQQQELFISKMVSNEDLLTARSAYRIAEANVTIASASVLTAEEDLNDARESYADTEIRSPVDGLVLEQLVEEGQIISSGISSTTGGTLIMTIGDMGALISEAEVDEVDIGNVKVGQRTIVEVDAYEGEEFEGVLTHISPKGEIQSNVTVFSVEIEITAPQKAKLLAGMTNTAEIIYEDRQNVLSLPVKAVRSREGRSGVLIKDNDHFVPRRVTTGISDYKTIEIVNGLSEGQIVYYPSTQKKDSQSDDPKAKLAGGRIPGMRGMGRRR